MALGSIGVVIVDVTLVGVEIAFKLSVCAVSPEICQALYRWKFYRRCQNQVTGYSSATRKVKRLIRKDAGRCVALNGKYDGNAQEEIAQLSFNLTHTIIPGACAHISRA